MGGVTTEEIARSEDPFVRQFMLGQSDGPVPFHVVSRPYAVDVGLAARAPYHA